MREKIGILRFQNFVFQNWKISKRWKRISKVGTKKRENDGKEKKKRQGKISG
jgi:hypothetical protein